MTDEHKAIWAAIGQLPLAIKELARLSYCDDGVSYLFGFIGGMEDCKQHGGEPKDHGIRRTVDDLHEEDETMLGLYHGFMYQKGLTTSGGSGTTGG